MAADYMTLGAKLSDSLEQLVQFDLLTPAACIHSASKYQSHIFSALSPLHDSLYSILIFSKYSRVIIIIPTLNREVANEITV